MFFTADVKKAKVFAGLVLLCRPGKVSWLPEDWNNDAAFRQLSTDIERSNPGITLEAKPSWVGQLGKFHSRKQSCAGLLLVVRLTSRVKEILESKNPRIVIGGKVRMCRAWNEENGSQICARCCQIGDNGNGCKNTPVCKFYRDNHESSNYFCMVTGCGARQCTCLHTTVWCMSCQTDMHYAGDGRCPEICANTPQVTGRNGRSPVVAYNGSVTGVTDRTRNRERNKGKGLAGTPLNEKAAAGEVGPKASHMVETKGYALRKKDHSKTELAGAKVLGIPEGLAFP